MQAYKDNGEIVLSYKYQSLIEVNARLCEQITTIPQSSIHEYQSLIEVNAKVNHLNSR